MNEDEVYQILEEGLSTFKGVFEESDFTADFRPSLSDIINDCRIVDYDAIDKLREALKPVNECLEKLKKEPAEMSDYAKKIYFDEREWFKKELEEIEKATQWTVDSENESYIDLTFSIPDFDDLDIVFQKETHTLELGTDYECEYPFDQKEIERVAKETAEKYENVTVKKISTFVLTTKGNEPTTEEIKRLASARTEGLINLSPLRYNGVERKFYREDIY